MDSEQSSSRVDKRHRTAEWVREQTTQVYAPPPPSSSSTSSPTSMSRRTSSNRTTSSSEQSVAGPSSAHRHRGVPPSPSHTSPFPSPTASGLSWDTQRGLPFPQSPPGSGYPCALEVAAPRAEPERVSLGRSSDRDAYSRCIAALAQPRRPSILKKRRPSLVDHVRSYSSMTIPWKRDEGGRKEEPGKQR